MYEVILYRGRNLVKIDKDMSFWNVNDILMIIFYSIYFVLAFFYNY